MTDLRLVFPALAAWGAVGVSLWLLSSIRGIDQRHNAGMTLAVAAAIAIPLCLVLLWRRGAAFVIAVSGLVALVSVGVHVAAWSSPALEQSVGEGVVVRGHIDGPPRAAIGVTYLPMRTSSIDKDRSFGMDIPVTISIPETEGEQVDLPVGTPIDVTGRLRASGNVLRTAAYLDADARDIKQVGPAPPVDRLAQRIRIGLHESLPAHPASGSALVAGLAIGDETAMSPQLREAMRASGLAHLTAVSGGNVAIVVGVVVGLAWLIRLPLLARIAVALAALGFYVILVHPQPSVLRAGVMGAVVLVSLLVGGRRPGPSILAIAVIILVITVPSLALSWGFGLSVAATGGIVMWAPVLQRRLSSTRIGERTPDPVLIGVSLTLAAQLATAPVLIAMGVSVGLAAVPANVLAMPVVPLVTVTGLAAAVIHAVPFIGFITIPIAGFVAWCGAWAAEWIARVAMVASEVDVFRFSGSVVTSLLLVAAAVLGVLTWRRGPRALVIATGSVLAVAVVLWSLFPPSRRAWPPPNWVMMQCDVGQGDGFVIAGQAPGEGVVVDTGRSARDIDDCLSELGIESISLLVLTHFHADHVAGLAGVLNGRRVEAAVATGWQEPEAQFLGVQRTLRDHGVELQTVGAGAQFSLDGGQYRVLWPRRFITTGGISSGSAANNASVVVDARVHGLRVLLTGDIEPPAQAAVLAERGGFDLVKIPHHGSAHQHPEFADWADADAAVVSVGADNGFGHPADSTLLQWAESGATVLRTDQHGDIAIVHDESEDTPWALVPRNGLAE